jgi:hypothetical protein
MRQTVRVLLAALILSGIPCPLLAKAEAGDEPLPKPDPAKPAAAAPYTEHDYRRALLAHNRRTMGGEYNEIGSRGAWDAEAVKLLDAMAVHFTYGPTWPQYRTVPVPTREELIKAGRAVVAAGCDDPLVRYCLAAMLDDHGDDAEALAILKEVVPALDDSGYPDFRVAAAANRLLRHEPDNHVVARIPGERLVKLPFLADLDDIARRDYLDAIWEHVQTLPNRGRQFGFLDACRGRFGGDPWMLDVLEGRLLIKRAWDARGYGYADTVTDDGWEKFHKDLALARDVLTSAWKLRPDLPEAATEMITVCMGAGERLGEDEREWFARATAAELDFEPAYDAIREALMPRWGGSHAAVLKVGFDALETGRFDTRLPGQLADCTGLVAADLGGWAPALELPGVREGLIRMAEGYAKALESIGEHRYYATLPAALAWRSGDHAEARRVLERLGDGGIDPGPFRLVGAQDPAAALGQAWVMGGPHADRAGAAEAARNAGGDADNEAALAAFQALASELAGEPRAKLYLDARVRTLDHRVRFARGEWVDLQPASLAGWRTLFGTWDVAPDGALVGRPAVGKEHAYLICEEDFGNRFEVSMRLDALAPASAPCITFARGTAAYAGDVRVTMTDVSLLSRNDGARTYPAATTAPVEMTVRCDAGRVNLRVNDKEWTDVPYAPAALPGLRVGVGAQGRGAVRFGGLKIRKLTD